MNLYKDLLLFTQYLVLHTCIVACEEVIRGPKELDKYIQYTEDFFLKYVPGALGEDEEIQGLQKYDDLNDVSIVSVESDIINENDNLLTKGQLEDRNNDNHDVIGISSSDNFYEDMSIIDEDKESEGAKDSDKSPSEEEQKRFMKYDTDAKKKLLRLRKKRRVKDIPLGPQPVDVAMGDVFGGLGDPDLKADTEEYGLQTYYETEQEKKQMNDLWLSITHPFAFREKKIWGYDKDGNPICSRDKWLENTLQGGVVESNYKTKCLRHVDYTSTPRMYATDGFLNGDSLLSVISILQRYREIKNKRKNKIQFPIKIEKVSKPVISMAVLRKSRSTLNKDEKKRLYDSNIDNIEFKSRVNNLEGVTDLDGVIKLLGLDREIHQRKAVEEVFLNYTRRIQNGRFNIKFVPLLSKSHKNILSDWRENLFDQAIENIGRYDPRASQKFELPPGCEEVHGIPPSQIITDMSSEVIRRPPTNLRFSSLIKSIQNKLFDRKLKMYKEYVKKIVENRNKSESYIKMISSENKFEERLDWLKKFNGLWMFIPQIKLIKPIGDFNSNINGRKEILNEEKRERDLLSLELEMVPFLEQDIYISSYIKGDVLFPDKEELSEKKALFRKIAHETAMYDEKLPYKLPYRPTGRKKLITKGPFRAYKGGSSSTSDGYSNIIVKKGKVQLENDEKQEIKKLEKENKKQITKDMMENEQTKDSILTNFILEDSAKPIKKTKKLSGTFNLENEHNNMQGKVLPSTKIPPFSTTKVSIIQNSKYNPIRRKTVFDQ
ncbi:uncharacterized protein CMU_028300 [Cryptosporidium muris RN66]|uniref:Uncharacterized protein n=1 Tax=Cryptosporidium muris (strain RN66) TaxID=441375 RepID=B6AK60_CRYMR|nr:uncharacterized protein CMU_028300 [Cryptosporidium muris RN66]EEA08601.1 hypothetical protein, conserved [Cryptosporidium muris RN66]|eukprot:XP_002142950.1 hypothetical protein [Cryptosporidium muris RN66]